MLNVLQIIGKIERHTPNAFIMDDGRDLSPYDIFVVTERNIDFLSQAVDNNITRMLVSSSVLSQVKQEIGNIQAALNEEDFYKNEGNIKYIEFNKDQFSVSEILKSYYSCINSNIISCVTGTNGKTSTTSFVRQILTAIGKNALSIESGEAIIGDCQDINFRPSLTTPSTHDSHKIIYIAQKNYNTKYTIFEASSHGLHQNRLDGLTVNVAAFTNLSQDHLDYHKTMEEYFECKKLLFSHKLDSNGIAVLNSDVPQYNDLLKICKDRNITVRDYGYKSNDIKITSAVQQGNKLSIMLKAENKELNWSISCVGSFQAYNFTCAIGIVLSLGVKIDDLVDKNILITAPAGRMEQVICNGKTTNIFIDYAHTPDALKEALKNIKSICKGRVILVFGCGGNRDKDKRGVLGNIANDMSDVFVITNDNPRFEDSNIIRNDIKSGIKKANAELYEIPNRKEAIAKALSLKKEGDFVLIAGKGHEKYQIIKGKKQPFDDYQIAKEYYQSKNLLF